MTFKKRFQHFQELNKHLSSVINFGRAVMGQSMTKDEIKKNIKLLDRNDYQLSDRADLVSHYHKISKEGSFNGLTERLV